VTVADEPASSRATITQVYDLIGELRKEVFTAIGDLDKKQEDRFSALLTSLEGAVNAIRGDFVPEKLCVERHDAHQSALDAAVKASEEDRSRLWERIREIERVGKWAAAAIITAFLGMVVYLLEQHFVRGG
jgi:hypothetical protein